MIKPKHVKFCKGEREKVKGERWKPFYPSPFPFYLLQYSYVYLCLPTYSKQIAYSQDGFKYIDYEVEVEAKYFEMVQVSEAVGYYRNNRTGEIAATYAGFNDKSLAEKWGRFLTVKNKIAKGFQSRKSERMVSFQHELKLWEMSFQSIQKLAELNLTKAPPSQFENRQRSGIGA